MNHDEARQRCIIYAYRGSIAHGTYLNKKDPYSVDDRDTIGVYIPPIEYFLGLKEPRTIEHKEGDEDAVYYDIQKMFSLLLKCNPNVLSILWLQPIHHNDCYQRCAVFGCTGERMSLFGKIENFKKQYLPIAAAAVQIGVIVFQALRDSSEQ